MMTEMSGVAVGAFLGRNKNPETLDFPSGARTGSF